MQKAQTVVRQRVAKELLQTEQSYVDSLKTVCELLITPIASNAKRGLPIIKDDEFFGVFANIEELLEYHKHFLCVLQPRIDQWSDSTTVGDIFLREVQMYN